MKNVLLGLLLLMPLSVAYGDSRQVSVSASGEVSAQPDMAIIRGRVISEDKTAKRAMDDAHRQLSALIDVALAHGVSKEDLQAAQVLVQPRWHYPRNGSREVDGYQGTAEFTIRLKDLSRLSDLYSNLVDAGANHLQPTQFDFSNRDALELQAITAAVEKAKRKAEAALQPLGERVGQAISINVDTRWQGPQPVYARMEMAAADAAPRKVNMGKQSLTANVRAVFDIK